MEVLNYETHELNFNQANVLPVSGVEMELTLVLCQGRGGRGRVFSAAGLSLIISALPLAEAELLDCEGKSDSSLEREPAEDDSKGADGSKKRKRKPYRPGRAPD